MIVSTASTATNVMTEIIKALYGAGKDFNAFIDKHIEEMKVSDNTTISRTGRVIDGAKLGFGLGYTVPVTIIATGQMLLGYPFSAVSTALTTITFSNPVAMTCAAVGAIYYGWAALSDLERNEILEKLSHGLGVGIELIKSVIRFVIHKTKEFLSFENVLELKKYIASAAESFGRTLSDVTGSIADKIRGAFDVVAIASSDVVDKTKDLAGDAYTAATETAGRVVDAVKEKLDRPESK